MGTLNGVVEWGTAGLALPGQSVSGDRHVIVPTPTGYLVGVVDGLGHGEGGAAAAEACVRTLREYSSEPPLPLLERCHEQLHHTRGATLSLALLDTRNNTMTWVGVGDVAGVWIPVAGGVPRRHLACQGGVVGKNLPPLHATTLPLGPRDLVILATDGVEADFADELLPQDPCQRIADGILKRFARGTDDALVLVARYLGGVSGRR